MVNTAAISDMLRSVRSIIDIAKRANLKTVFSPSYNDDHEYYIFLKTRSGSLLWKDTYPLLLEHGAKARQSFRNNINSIFINGFTIQPDGEGKTHIKLHLEDFIHKYVLLSEDVNNNMYKELLSTVLGTVSNEMNAKKATKVSA